MIILILADVMNLNDNTIFFRQISGSSGSKTFSQLLLNCLKAVSFNLGYQILINKYIIGIREEIKICSSQNKTT